MARRPRLGGATRRGRRLRQPARRGRIARADGDLPRRRPNATPKPPALGSRPAVLGRPARCETISESPTAAKLCNGIASNACVGEGDSGLVAGCRAAFGGLPASVGVTVVRPRYTGCWGGTTHRRAVAQERLTARATSVPVTRGLGGRQRARAVNVERADLGDLASVLVRAILPVALQAESHPQRALAAYWDASARRRAATAPWRDQRRREGIMTDPEYDPASTAASTWAFPMILQLPPWSRIATKQPVAELTRQRSEVQLLPRPPSIPLVSRLPDSLLCACLLWIRALGPHLGHIERDGEPFLDRRDRSDQHLWVVWR